MATITNDIAAIRTAIFGKDVREAIADGLTQMNQATTDLQTAIQNINLVTDDGTGIVIKSSN